jgi:hypothetical protein
VERSRTYAEQRPYADPPGRLADLTGPTEGVVELPVTIDWGPRRTYDLAAEADRRILYERVTREAASTDEVCRWIDGTALQAVWPQLWLPERLRRSWEAVLPELRSPAA